MLCLKTCTGALVLIFLAACTTTPNLAGWAESSADLSGVVAFENNAVLRRIDHNIVELQIGEAEGWTLGNQTSVRWQQRRDTYQQNATDINGVMDAMALYANAIANLAAAGETGEASVQRINGSITEIVSLVGRTNPISAGTIAVLEGFADAWTRVEAQDSLADAMLATQANVDAMASQITEVTNAQLGVLNNIHALERRLIRQAAGPNRMSWYVKNKGYMRVEEAFENGKEIEQAAAMTHLINSLEPRYRERQNRRVDSIQWFVERKLALRAIDSAAKTWSNSHSQAANLLKDCGGLRSLRFSCGQYSIANLKLAADRIRQIAPNEAPPPPPQPEADDAD